MGSTFGKSGLQGPLPVPLLGNMVDMFSQGMQDFFVKGIKEYGRIYGMFMPSGPAVVVADPELLKEVFVKKFSSFPNRHRMLEFELDPWRYNLLALRDDHWKRVRTQLSPAFSSRKLMKMKPAIETVLVSLEKNTKLKAESGEAVDLKKFCGAFAMDAIAGAAFGIQVDSLVSPGDPFVKHAYSILDPKDPAFVLMMMFPWMTPLFRKVGIKFIKDAATRFFTCAVDSALADRRQDGQDYGDFLQVLADMEKEESGEPEHVKGLSQNEIYANAIIFLLAGYDTVSTAMAFTLYCLAANPACLEKAQNEVDKLGKEALAHGSMADMSYLDHCVSEALRLYPPGALVVRQANEDVELGGHKILKGWLIMIPAYAIHRDPQFWNDPDTFDPERFSPQGKVDQHPFTYFPFGAGPRVCIGMRLALMELRLALATLLKSYVPVLTAESEYPPELSKVKPHMTPKDGLWVTFQSRPGHSS